MTTVASGPERPDRRRATAERNAAAILDAAERLLARNVSLSMVAIAAEAGLSRPTVYAHYRTIAAIVEAAVERSLHASVAAFEAAQPDVGPADEALRRMVATSWGLLAHFDALARGAAEHLTAASVHRTHEPMMDRLRTLVERGQRDGSFRRDLPVDWLVSVFIALMHGAYEHARAHGLARDRALELLLTSVDDVFGTPAARRAEGRATGSA